MNIYIMANSINHNEIWKPIVGYENLYEVSNIGAIKRLKSTQGHKKGQLLSPVLCTGYLRVGLTKNKNIKNKYVHRLVLEAFTEHIPRGMECNHKNGIRADNRIENLEWVTRSYNSWHKCNILKFKIKRKRNGRAKFKQKDVNEILKLSQEGYSSKDLAKKFKVNVKTINNIKSGRTKEYED